MGLPQACKESGLNIRISHVSVQAADVVAQAKKEDTVTADDAVAAEVEAEEEEEDVEEEADAAAASTRKRATRARRE